MALKARAMPPRREVRPRSLRCLHLMLRVPRRLPRTTSHLHQVKLLVLGRIVYHLLVVALS